MSNTKDTAHPIGEALAREVTRMLYTIANEHIEGFNKDTSSHMVPTGEDGALEEVQCPKYSNSQLDLLRLGCLNVATSTVVKLPTISQSLGEIAAQRFATIIDGQIADLKEKIEACESVENKLASGGSPKDAEVYRILNTERHRAAVIALNDLKSMVKGS